MNVKRREGDEKKKRGSNLSSFREGGGIGRREKSTGEVVVDGSSSEYKSRRGCIAGSTF